MSAETLIAEYRVLDQPPAALQGVVETAALVAGVPLASVNIFTAGAQHQVAVVGMAPTVVRREHTMCAVAVDGDEPVVTGDARLDPRFADHPFVTGERGSIRFYASHPLRTPDGTVIGTLCVFDDQPREPDAAHVRSLAHLADRVVDVLELDRRTRALQSALRSAEDLRAELERSNEHLAAFAGQVSHDLANPLATVAMALQLLELQLGAVPADAVESLRTAQRGADRMRTLVAEVLAYARVGGSLQRRPVDLATTTASVVADLGDALAGTRLEVGPLPTVPGDPVQLSAVLANLLGNAAKHAGPTPTVEVGARRVEAGWRVEVTDDGPGIDPADAERAFEPLVRLDAAGGDGSGLGLATCRRVVEAHGGTIGLLARPDGGTVAWFELPAV
ncbi:GAF domain-containing sensor histidine kinase [Nocardioides sp. ChNu-153]|uniref:GAF domain-containing sensor histidine kinase n=1 Tax=unclassified Nocardioides TaxID=2615069 RepID=UPI0024074F2E|nr:MULTISPECIES: GAF domain-containing sensor histidine kinase [unclassified Nocardioides]MDF9715179.1 GAF domain-containing sensor histidine kinase [Nocardioides sp. ChNu-99]MDN7121042.1 GAF domain-containing sensor histidine kinase [Nocardioides sp. ChNu-153]